MKKAITQIGAILMSALLCCVVMPQTAFAAGTAEIIIPVDVSISGSAPTTPETYTIEIKADSDSFPLPTGAIDGAYSLSVTGAGKANFPAISYSKVGVYSYTISQKSGTNLKGHYDSTAYKLTVYVTNNEIGSGLEATAVMHISGTADKPVLARFTNSYDAETVALTVEKVWVDNGKNRPSSVNISLYDGDKLVETIRLGGGNGWKHTWKDLNADGNWTVSETNIPKGYAVSYTYKDGYIMVVNTASLIQTGQLNWPIPVLSALGLALVVFGVIKIRRKKSTDEAQ